MLAWELDGLKTMNVHTVLVCAYGAYMQGLGEKTCRVGMNVEAHIHTCKIMDHIQTDADKG